MSAKRKLNTANVLGALIVAAFIGGLVESWLAFAVATITLIGTASYTGDIRR